MDRRIPPVTITRFLLTAVLAVSLIGCLGAPERRPVPAELTREAALPGMPYNARMWADELDPVLEERFRGLSEQEYRQLFPAIYGVPHDYLALSGGGANGAFGAGLLVGWSDSGTRPEFAMVTGISTGALAAPFAFLGSDYDEHLRELYTTTSTRDLVEERGLFGKLFSDALSDTKPLRDVVER